MKYTPCMISLFTFVPNLNLVHRSKWIVALCEKLMLPLLYFIGCNLLKSVDVGVIALSGFIISVPFAALATKNMFLITFQLKSSRVIMELGKDLCPDGERVPRASLCCRHRPSSPYVMFSRNHPACHCMVNRFPDFHAKSRMISVTLLPTHCKLYSPIKPNLA